MDFAGRPFKIDKRDFSICSCKTLMQKFPLKKKNESKKFKMEL